MANTLEDLRAENAAAEAASAQVPQAGASDVEDAAADDLNADDDLAEDSSGEEGQEAEPESWMKGDDQESHGAEKKFTDRDIGAAKAKLRAKIEREKQSELDALHAQLEELRSKTVAPQQLARPKREDFYDNDDPDDAYTEALADWKIKEAQAHQYASTQQYEAQRKQLESQQKISRDVDQHYERAAQLSAQSGISPELYHSADHRVRSAIEGVFPNMGDHITDELIASLGDGSEKVFYALGVSQKRLEAFIETMKNDPKGIKTAVHLGKLAAELASPTRKKSNTPAPAATVQGDANTTDAGKSFQRKYLEAHKRGDSQAAFSIRREAKAANINVNSW